MIIETFEDLGNAPNYKYTVNFIPETDEDVQKLEELKEYMHKQQVKQQAEFDIISGKFPHKPVNEINPSVYIPCKFTTNVIRDVKIKLEEEKANNEA